MPKEEPIQLTREGWQLYERAAHKLRLIHERDARAWDTLQERHHENYRQQRKACAATVGLYRAEARPVVEQLVRDALLNPGDVPVEE